MAITKYEGQKFTKGAFVMEECFFINCALTDCDLFYSGGSFEWVNCRFDNCRWHWRGPALNTMQLLTTIGLLKVPQTPSAQNVDASKMN